MRESEAIPAPRFLGARVKRVEDPRFLRGEARFLDDLRLAGQLHLVFVRSPHAHARVVRVDRGPALEAPGVETVMTAADVAHLAPKPIALRPAGFHVLPRSPLAANVVRYVGQPVAAVVARDLSRARDAAELVRVDYEPLPAATSPERALEPDAPFVHPTLDSNIAFEQGWTLGDIDEAFLRRREVVRGRFIHPRLAAAPIETRGCAAHYDGTQLTAWISTQMPHLVRNDLAVVFALPEQRVRVVAPEVGGGFGCKVGLYDDEIVTAAAAFQLRRPVKWVETRSENFVATSHGRGQRHDAELALAADGTFLALRVRGVADLGAYVETYGASPALLTGRLITGAYRIPAASFTVRGVYTHLTPTGTYRGAGRPEAAYLIERLVDAAAAELQLDPVEIRRRNLIRPEEFPYRVPSGLTYDNGRYAFTLDRALALAGYAQYRAMQAQARREGRIGRHRRRDLRGDCRERTVPLGRFRTVGVRSRPRRPGRRRGGPHRHLPTRTGTGNHVAQIVAGELGLELRDITVLHGDTAVVPIGYGTGGSRGTAVGGTAVYLAARKVKAKMRELAAHLLEAAPEDLVFGDGRLYVRGTPTRTIEFREVARAAYRGARCRQAWSRGSRRRAPGTRPTLRYRSAPISRWSRSCRTPAPYISGGSLAWMTWATSCLRCSWRGSCRAGSRRASRRRCGKRWSTMTPDNASRAP